MTIKIRPSDEARKYTINSAVNNFRGDLGVECCEEADKHFGYPIGTMASHFKIEKKKEKSVQAQPVGWMAKWEAEHA